MYWSIDDKNSTWDHRNIKGFNYITDIIYLIFVLLIDDEYTVEFITM